MICTKVFRASEAKSLSKVPGKSGELCPTGTLSVTMLSPVGSVWLGSDACRMHFYTLVSVLSAAGEDAECHTFR